MACCSVVSHWCKWCMFIMLPCSQRALILVLEHMGNFGVRLPPGCSCHGVSVHCLCVQMLSFYTARWPVLPICMQLTLVSWYVASMLYVATVGCSVWVMLFRYKVIPLKVWVLCQCGRTDLCAAYLICLVSYRSIFLHEIGGISWLTLWRCWLRSCGMFILLAEYGLVYRGDCMNCETCYFCFDPAFVWPSLGRADF